MNKHEEARRIADWLNNELKPNAYVVLTLKQAVPSRTGGLTKGSRQIYDTVYHCLLVRVTKRIYGTTHYRRMKRLIPNVGTLEGDGIKRFHINMCLHCPTWLPFETLRTIILEEWHKEEWAMPDTYFERITGNAVGYSLKEGPEALLSGSLSF